MISIEALRYAWPGAAADCIAIDTLTIAAGESVFVHSPSGGGKSTLLGLLAGVLVPQHGDVRLLDAPWQAMSGAQRDRHRADHVGYIFQQFNLLPYLDAVHNVLLPCRFSPRRRERAAADAGSPARSLLERVGLAAPDWRRPASQLSVGQQQRVAAARALIGRPEVVIADEPTSALDAPLRESFMDLLLGQCRAVGSTLVFVSHDERLAARFERTLPLSAVNRARRDEAAA